MLDLANNYNKALEEEDKMTPEQVGPDFRGAYVPLTPNPAFDCPADNNRWMDRSIDLSLDGITL